MHSSLKLTSRLLIKSTSEIDQGSVLRNTNVSDMFSKNAENAKILRPCPFKMHWINGYNHKVGVINLNDNGSTLLFYSASNCGVLYNWTTRHMWILQGHRHMIQFIACNATGKWLVTADSGPENVIIIWDRKDLFPQKTIFSPHGTAKTGKVALSADAKYLLTMAYIPGEKVSVYWWIWAFGHNTPHATQEIQNLSRDCVIEMGFDPHTSEKFLLLTKSAIFVGISRKIFITERGMTRETDKYELKIRELDTKRSVDHGKLVCYTFVKGTSQILVATNRGMVLVYGYAIEYQTNIQSTNIDNLRYIKTVKLNKKMINVIKNIDGVIVTGNSLGEIHFYDDQLKLMYWVHGFTVDKVKGLSFNLSPRSSMILDPQCGKPCVCWEKVEVEKDPVTGQVKQKLVKMRLPFDATVTGKPFLVRDFIVCTFNQGVGFVDFVTEKYNTILDNMMSQVLSISVHPEKPFLCIGYTDGMVELFNFVQHKLVSRLDLRDRYTVVVPPNDDSIDCNFEVTVPQLSVTCIKFSPSGLHLSCGLNTGQVVFLDPTNLEVLFPSPFHDTRHAIKYISFCDDSLTMATADAGRTVCVYKYKCKTHSWVFFGKHRAHYKDITSITFLPEKNPDGEYKLVSLAMDRCMVEYDIAKSSEECLEIMSLDRVEQAAQPLSCIVWPTPKDLDPEECRTDLPMILIANDEFKYKIINYSTTMTLATVLGPRYDYPVSKMQLITRKDNDEEQQYLLFAAKDIIGLQKMPLDGNPWKHVGLLGHPTRVLQMCFREDLGILFTIGAKDTTVTQWAANYRSVETSAKRGGTDLDPYYCLVDDGRPGWLFQEIRDLFYYVQILCQGTFSPARRRVKDYIPTDSLPDLMRALGFFPSEYEVENLLVEAKFKVYLRSPATEIDFEEFVKLYLNHRPAFGENFKRIRYAFRNFASISNDGYVMSRDDFIEMLTANGERFSRELCWYLLTILCGHSYEDRAVMTEDDFSFLPEYITFTDFLNEIIGIHEIENLSDSFSGGESWVSTHSLDSTDSDEKGAY